MDEATCVACDACRFVEDALLLYLVKHDLAAGPAWHEGRHHAAPSSAQWQPWHAGTWSFSAVDTYMAWCLGEVHVQLAVGSAVHLAA